MAASARPWVVRFRAVDGFSKSQRFATPAGAAKALAKRLGRFEEGTDYAVSYDGIVTAHVDGPKDHPESPFRVVCDQARALLAAKETPKP